MKSHVLDIVALFISLGAFGLAYMTRIDGLESTESEWHARLRGCLESLADLERQSLQSDAPTSCGADEDLCLGHLAMKRAFRDQYRLITAEAFDLAERIPKRITTTEEVELATALYNAGDTTQSAVYIKRALEPKPGFLVEYRAQLLEAQISFSHRKFDDGANRIRDAISLVDSQTDLTSIERPLLHAEAHLVCANMHIALGFPQDAVACLKHAHEKLAKLPKTRLVNELNDSVRAQVSQVILLENRAADQSFDDLVAGIRAELRANDEDQSVVPLPRPQGEPTLAPPPPRSERRRSP